MHTPTEEESQVNIDYGAARTYLLEAPELTKGMVTSCRVKKDVAELLLYRNASLLKGGNRRYFALKHLGLGVYEVKLRPVGKENTYLVEKWEEHLIPSAPGLIPTQYF